MNKKNTLIFLHGSGFDKFAYRNIVEQVSNYFDAELLAIQAKIPHTTNKNGYMWFNKFVQENRRDAVQKDYENSLEYIKNEVLQLNQPLENIIVLGHSQGGTMAIALAFELELKKTITICADMPYNLEYSCKTNTPIDWYEAKNDGYIDKSRQESYKLIKDITPNFNFKILQNSTHSNFEQDILNLIKTNQL